MTFWQLQLDAPRSQRISEKSIEKLQFSSPKPFEKEGHHGFPNLNIYKYNQTHRTTMEIPWFEWWFSQHLSRYIQWYQGGSPTVVSQGLEALLLSPVLSLDAESETWLWKDPPFLMGKLTISMGHFQVRKLLVYQRVSKLTGFFCDFLWWPN